MMFKISTNLIMMFFLWNVKIRNIKIGKNVKSVVYTKAVMSQWVKVKFESYD